MQDWIWQSDNWVNFTWEDEIILPKTKQIHQKIGILLGQSQHDLAKEQFTLDTLLANIVASSAIENETLEQTPENDSNIIDWLVWFLDTLNDSLKITLKQINRTLFKSQFWHKYSNLDLHERQRKVLNRLLNGGENGFEHGISASQYQKVAKGYPSLI